MNEVYRDRVTNLKRALLEYLGKNGRYYGQLTRMEQSVEDLAQALNTRLDQLLMNLDSGNEQTAPEETPREKLSARLMSTAAILTRHGNVDAEMADQFDQALDAFDMASDLRRQSETVRDAAESAAIKHKRGKT